MEKRDFNDKMKYAKKRAKNIVGLYIHLFVYLVLNTVGFIINVILYNGTWWFHWVLFFAGFGLAIHFIVVALVNSVWLRQFEKRIMNKILKKLNEDN